MAKIESATRVEERSVESSASAVEWAASELKQDRHVEYSQKHHHGTKNANDRESEGIQIITEEASLLGLLISDVHSRHHGLRARVRAP